MSSNTGWQSAEDQSWLDTVIPQKVDNTEASAKVAPTTLSNGFKPYKPDDESWVNTLVPQSEKAPTTAAPESWMAQQKRMYNENAEKVGKIINESPLSVPGYMGAFLPTGTAGLKELMGWHGNDLDAPGGWDDQGRPLDKNGVPMTPDNTQTSIASLRALDTWDKIKSWFHTPDVSPAKAANIVALSQANDVSPLTALRHYDQLRREVFPNAELSTKELVGHGMQAAVMAGVLTDPVATLAGVGIFMGLDEVENAVVSKVKDKPYKFGAGKGIADLLEAEGLSRDALDLVDFLWKVPVAGSASKTGRGMMRKLVDPLVAKAQKVDFINRIAKRVKTENISPDEAAVEEARTDPNTDDSIKAAQEKIIEVQKQQAELQSKKNQEALDYGKMINEDLLAKGKRVADQKKLVLKKSEDLDHQINKALNAKRKAAGKEPFPETPSEVVPKPNILEADQYYHSPAIRQQLRGEDSLYKDQVFVEKGDDPTHYIGKSKDIQRIELPEDPKVISLDELAERYSDAITNNKISKEKLLSDNERLNDMLNLAWESGFDLVDGGTQFRVVNPSLPRTNIGEVVGKEASRLTGATVQKVPGVSKPQSGTVRGHKLPVIEPWITGEAKTGVEIPDFSKDPDPTDAAIEFGKKATDEQMKALAEKFLEAKKRNVEARANKNRDAAMEESFKAQFYREAIEAKIGQGKVNQEGTTAEEVLGKSSEESVSYTSKKGNTYTKQGDTWYDADGNKVENKFKIRALEKGIVRSPEEAVKELEAKQAEEAEQTKVESKTAEAPKQELTPEEQLKDLKSKKMKAVRAKDKTAVKQLGDQIKKLKKEEEVRRKKENIAFEDAKLIKTLEDYYEKPIDQITDKEIEKFWLEDAGIDTSEITGRKTEELSTEKSPFRQAPEQTAHMSEWYKTHKWSDNIESIVAKQVNDVNEWLDGKDSDIESIRNQLSNLATMSDDPAHRTRMLDAFEGDTGKMQNFIEMIKEAAAWARRADRSKIEQTSGDTLYSGIPIDFILEKLKRKLKKEGGIFSGEPASLHGDTIYDKAGRQLETVKEAFARLDKEEITTGKLIGRVLTTDIIDPVIDKLLYKKGERLTEDKIKEMQKAGLSLDYLLEKGTVSAGPRDIEGGVTLRSGISPPDIKEHVTKLFKSAEAKAKEARSIKNFNLGEATKRTREAFNRQFIDKSANLRRELLNKLGDKGYDIVQKMHLIKGASSLALSNLKQMQKEVYGGLSRAEKETLDDIIFHSRILDIAKYKTAKEFKELKKYTPEEAIVYISLFGKMKGLDPKVAHELYHVNEDGSIGGRAGAYFGWMKKVLKDMKDEGLITDKEFEDLSSHNYRRLEVAEVFDKKHKSLTRKGISVYDSGIESLARGRDTTIFERDADVMALEVFNRAYGRILRNRANKTLLDLARTNKDNPFARVKESKEDKIPSGWHQTFAYENGERKAIYISPETAKEWLVSDPQINPIVAQIMRWSTLSPVLKTFATGINWSFALANLPMDIMHTWFAARTFEGGKWEPLYSSHLPLFGLQMARDQLSVFGDALLRGKRYQDYMDQGGGMEFLVHQGRLFRRGKHVGSEFTKLQDFFGYLGETSELMTRLSIRERAIRAGKSPEEATFIARDYMDFSQGGGFTKVVDLGIPYLNASIVGTRGFLRAFKDNPIKSTYKIGQFGATVTGIYLASKYVAPKTWHALKNSLDSQNNICIPLGDKFGFEDEHGEMVYPYLKIPLDHDQRFFKKFFEASTDKQLGEEVDINGTINSLTQLSPVDTGSLPPLVSATLGYMMNKNFWADSDIWKGASGPLPWPESQAEYNKYTPEGYVDLGKATGLSPERTRYAVKQIFTNGTLWSAICGLGYDKLFGDLPASKRQQHLAEILSRAPMSRRFIGLTRPSDRFSQVVNEAKVKAAFEKQLQTSGLELRTQAALVDKTIPTSEVYKYIYSFKDRDVRQRLRDRFRFAERTQNLGHYSLWMKLRSLDTDARAQAYIKALRLMTPQERVTLLSERSAVRRAGGVFSPEFRSAVRRLTPVE